MVEIPSYAPLNITYDRKQLYNEILNACTPHLKDTALFRRPARKYHDEGKKYGLSSCSDEDFEKLTLHYLNEHGERCKDKKEFNSWQTMNLTHVTGEDDTLWVNHRKINEGPPIPLRELFSYKWEWRAEITNQISILKAIIDEFNFKYLNQVRLLIMNPPSFAGLHLDCQNSEFFNNGFTAITLNVASGGGDLIFLDKNYNPSIADSSVCAWHFNDHRIHGVTKCNEKRMQIRIVGKTTVSKYLSLMNLNKAIW